MRVLLISCSVPSWLFSFARTLWAVEKPDPWQSCRLLEPLPICRQDTHNTHLCSTVCSQATHRTRLAQELQCHLCALEKNPSSGPHMSHPSLLSHLPFTTSTSSSSFTLPSTTKQEHAAKSGQHDHLQEHPVPHEHLQALPVDKQRHQESLWRENLQSGGNPRTTTPTGYEPKELATVSRIEDYLRNPFQ